MLDAILSIGLWLEHTDHFVAGPLEPTDYLQLLQSLSLVSANCPEPTLRHAAHILTSNILHAHPTDRLRLNFISDTLEHCPFEPLRASAVGWLKEELVRAHTRKSDDLFGTPGRRGSITTLPLPLRGRARHGDGFRALGRLPAHVPLPYGGAEFDLLFEFGGV
ncbi:hypothetical protein VE04_05836 [Pseudogymnoascus sp. 24MN13]|nr:hypothetical protein VE04_05836 [Pseudogymnoascus sp. 24MN13]